MAMDARKQRILEAIVALYANDGEPVGSGLLANYFDMALSSATLRNEMAALTKLGLLEQPHTSAGRVPSAKGYRYYLDNLLTDDQPLDRVTRARCLPPSAGAIHFSPSPLHSRTPDPDSCSNADLPAVRLSLYPTPAKAATPSPQAKILLREQPQTL